MSGCTASEDEFSGIYSTDAVNGRSGFATDVKMENSDTSMSTDGSDDSSTFYSATTTATGGGVGLGGSKNEILRGSLDHDVDMNIFPGSLMCMSQSELGRGCYDVTLLDGTSGTIVNGLPEAIVGFSSPHTKENPAVKPEKTTPPPPPTVPRSIKESQCTKNEGPKNSEKKTVGSTPSTTRTGGRHHLIDIHGMAIFLRQSTRCLSCQEACCLYVTGTISAQLAAVTQVMITCQKCHYTASQALLKPNQGPEEMNLPQPTPPSETHSPHQTTPPEETYSTKDSCRTQLPEQLIPQPVTEITSRRNSLKPSKGKIDARKPFKSSLLPTIPFQIGDFMRPPEEIWSHDGLALPESLDVSSLSTGQARMSQKVPNLDFPQPKANVEWHTKSYSWTKRDEPSSHTPPYILPDIPGQSGLNSLSNICDDNACCPNKLGTSLCPVTGILRQLSPGISNLSSITLPDNFKEISQSSTLNKSEKLLRNHRKVSDLEGKDENAKDSFLAKLLHSNLHNIPSPVPSPSSSTSPCTYTSCTTTSPSFLSSASGTMAHPASSLLRLLSSPVLAPTLPLASQIQPMANTFQYQQALSPDVTTPAPQKRKFPDNVEESLQRVRNIIYNTRTPPKCNKTTYESTATGKPNNTNIHNQMCIQKCTPLVSDTKEENKIDFGRFINENYLEYLQDTAMLNTLGDSCCSEECHYKGTSKSKKQCKQRDHVSSKTKENKHHDKDTDDKCKRLNHKDNKHNQIQTINDTLIPPDNSPQSQDNNKALENGTNSRSSSPPVEKSSDHESSDRKSNRQCPLRPRITLKLAKRHFKERCQFDTKVKRKWIKANSVPCYCCHDPFYHKRVLMKQRNKTIQSDTKCKDDPSQMSDEERDGQQAEQETGKDYESTEENLYEFLNNCSVIKNPVDKNRKEKTFKNDSQHKSKAPSRHKIPKKKKKKKTDGISGDTDMDHSSDMSEQLEYHAVEKWMSSHSPEAKHQTRECTCGNCEHNSRASRTEHAAMEHSAKTGRFHDLLSSESDTDSDDEKLIIDFNA